MASESAYKSNESFIVTNTLRALVAQLAPEQKANVVAEVQNVLDNCKKSAEGDEHLIEWTTNLTEHILQEKMK